MHPGGEARALHQSILFQSYFIPLGASFCSRHGQDVAEAIGALEGAAVGARHRPLWCWRCPVLASLASFLAAGSRRRRRAAAPAGLRQRAQRAAVAIGRAALEDTPDASATRPGSGAGRRAWIQAGRHQREPQENEKYPNIICARTGPPAPRPAPPNRATRARPTAPARPSLKRQEHTQSRPC